jgi:endonuclease/exonuclease/phosphatase family metal-dependent hydrolase
MFSSLVRRIFIFLNIAAVIVFLIACLNWYINPSEWWFVALLGLGFPFLVALHIIFFIGWLIVRSKWAILSILALAIGFTNIRALIGSNFGTDFHTEREPGTLRLLSYNVHQFGFNSGHNLGLANREKIFDIIRNYNPDVICMQEFVTDIPQGKNHVPVFELFKRLGYKHAFFAGDYIQSKGKYTMGVAILSKLPMIDSFHLRYDGDIASMSAESLLAADIKFEDRTIRVFSTHLQSNRLEKEEYQQVSPRNVDKDRALSASKSIVKKLKTAYYYRSRQAHMVAAALDASPHPEIIAGDFNDIPNSYTYYQLKQNRLDAFVEKGRGLGRTFSHISPTLRIDYILTDKQFDVVQFQRIGEPYSDHYPIVTDLKLKAE